MANETGDMKILGNFRKLVDMTTADTLHDPSNPKIEVANLEAQLAASILSVDDIGVKMAPNKVAINARQEGYDEILAVVRGSRNILKASGASPEMIADADTFARKVLGLRKSKKKEDDPNTPTNEASQNHSASQQSYDAVLGNFRSYLQMLKSESLYSPNEAKYKTTTLETKADAFESLNNAVSATFVPLNNARSVRDDQLYTTDDCLCTLAAMVKAYAKAIHGATSQYFKTLNALSFKRTFR